MAYVNSTRTATGGFMDRLAAVMQSVNEAVARRRLYNQTVRELDALSDRELADMGLHRSMITEIALESMRSK